MNRFRLKEQQERFQREEAADLERKLAPIKAERSALQKHADAATKLFFSQSLAHLAGLINSGSFEADFGATYPRTEEKQSGARGQEQFAEFVHGTLPKRFGFLLSESGSQRLLYFVLCQAFSENKADMSSPDTWATAFDRLYALDCFDISKAEVGYDETLREVVPELAPERKLTIDDLESIDGSTREGQELQRQIVADAVFGEGGEARKVFQQFVTHVKEHFGHDLTEDEQRVIIEWFKANGRSFLSNSYDTCRVNLVRRGILSQSCLTEEEILANSIETEDTTSWDGRRRLKQELLASRNR